jgi:hypothetical protein
MKAYEKEFGVQIIHAWGMSESSPLGTVGRLKLDMESLDKNSKMKVR